MTLSKGADSTMVSTETVIDRSMTLYKGAGSTMVSTETVIDRSMTLFDDPTENCH